jgi:glycosyltransferase involved in cell wall biosynthesis
MRVAVLTNIVSPYRVPLFNAVAGSLEGRLLVVCAAKTEPLRFWEVAPENWRFQCRVLPGLHVSWMEREWHLHWNVGLRSVLRPFAPDVLVIGGYDQPLYWQGLWYARRRGIPVVLWYESWRESATVRRGIVFALKRFFVRRVTVGLPLGTPAAAWLLELRGEDFPVVVGLNTVDMVFFRRHVWQFRDSPDYARQRAQYPPLLLLYVGSLIPRKNVAVLLQALRMLRSEEVGLFVVGSGPQEQELRAFCKQNGLSGRVFFEGFRQQWELPRYYALADALVLPSLREVWGLVLNEALAAGLYVLSSTKVGAAYDLLQTGWNGELFEPNSPEQLSHSIQRLVEQLDEIRQRRDAISRHACQEFSIDRAAERFLEAVQLALGSNRG